MSLLERLRRRKAGPTPSTVDDLLGHQVLEVHLLARAVLSLQTRVDMLTDERRVLVGRLDELEGKPNSTMGDTRERIAQLREVARS